MIGLSYFDKTIVLAASAAGDADGMNKELAKDVLDVGSPLMHLLEPVTAVMVAAAAVVMQVSLYVQTKQPLRRAVLSCEVVGTPLSASRCKMISQLTAFMIVADISQLSSSNGYTSSPAHLHHHISFNFQLTVLVFHS